MDLAAPSGGVQNHPQSNPCTQGSYGDVALECSRSQSVLQSSVMILSLVIPLLVKVVKR